MEAPRVRPLLVFALLVLPGPVLAGAAPRTAVFDFELLDMSQEAGQGPRADETHRLELASAELRSLLKSSGAVDLVDVTPQAAALQSKAPLYKCNGCDEDVAKALGADLAIAGFVQKTSNLILSFVVTVKDVRSGQVVRAGQADIRGNTDETWLRGVRWIVKNRLLAEPLPALP
jgi:hypothetical protein